jgi:hypothetical protein
MYRNTFWENRESLKTPSPPPPQPKVQTPRNSPPPQPRRKDEDRRSRPSSQRQRADRASGSANLNSSIGAEDAKALGALGARPTIMKQGSKTKLGSLEIVAEKPGGEEV